MDSRYQPAFPVGSQSIPQDQKGLTKLEYVALHLFSLPNATSAGFAFIMAHLFFNEAEKNQAPEATTVYVPAGFEPIPGTDNCYRRKS